MDEIEMFINLGQLKSDIKDDLNKMDKILNDLDLKEIYNSNEEMSEKMVFISNDFKQKMIDANNRNNQLENEIFRMQNLNTKKDSEIDNLNQQIKQITEEKRKFEELYENEKNTNDKLNSQILIQCENNNLIEQNKMEIYNLFFNNN